jgi:hypothetical protein
MHRPRVSRYTVPEAQCRRCRGDQGAAKVDLVQRLAKPCLGLYPPQLWRSGFGLPRKEHGCFVTMVSLRQDESTLPAIERRYKFAKNGSLA